MLLQAPVGLPRSGHVIVLGNEKGGSGKSTTSMHVTVALMKEDEDRFLSALDQSAGRFLKAGPDHGKNIREFTDEPIGRVVRAY